MATVPPLTPEADALLNAIAKTESGGDWNVIYGGQRFNDYSSHPGVMVTIKSGPNKGQKSSAAGKFQITKTTYDRVAPKLGIADFSPESQKQIAWYLANEDYGPGLQQALESGDPAAIKSVATRLSSTWTSLPSGIESGTNGTKFLADYNRSLTNSGIGDVSPAASFSAIKGSVPTSQLGGVDERLLSMLGNGNPFLNNQLQQTPTYQPLPSPPPLRPDPAIGTPPGSQLSLTANAPVPMQRPTPSAPIPSPAPPPVATPNSGYDGTKRMASYQPFPSQFTIKPDAAVQMAKDAGMITGMAGMMPNGMIWSGALGQKGMGDTIAEQLGASGAGTFNTKNNVLTLSPDTMNQITGGLAKIPAPIRDMFGTNPAHYLTSNPNVQKVASVTMPAAETFPLPIPRPNPPQIPARAPTAPTAPTSSPSAAQMAAIRAVPPSSYYTGTAGPVISSAAPYQPPAAPQITPAQRAAMSAVPASSYYPAAPSPVPVYQPQMTPPLAPGLTAAQKYAMSALPPSSPYMPPMMLPNDAMAYGIGIPTLPQAPSALAPLVHRNIAPAPVWRPVPPPVQMVQIGSGRVVPVGTQGQRNGQGYAVQKDGSILHSGGWSTPAPGQPEKWWQANNPENW